jgi:hypothetical protein
MGKIEKIVLHCSDSEWGSAVEIDKWHRLRKSDDAYWPDSDGSFEWGRPLDQDNDIEPREIEAHAYGINSKSVGICLIGTNDFSEKQLICAKNMINKLLKQWGLGHKDVIGHYEVDSRKTCPNIDMDLFRKFLCSDFERSDSRLLRKLRK